MPIADMLTPIGQGRGMETLQANPTTFGEGFPTWVYDFAFNNPITGGLAASEQIEAFGQRDKLLEQQFGGLYTSDLDNQAGTLYPDSAEPSSFADAKMGTQTVAQRAEAMAARNDYVRGQRTQAILNGRSADPQRWAGIKTDAEIEEEVAIRKQFVRDTAIQTSAAAESEFDRFAAPLAAGLITMPLDPINLATLPLGAGASMGVLRAMKVEALLNMGVEAAEIPLIRQNEEMLGQSYTAADAAISVATAGVFGAGLTGALRGAPHAIGQLRNKALDRIIANPETPAEVRSAAQYMYRVNEVDEEIEPSLRENLSALDDAERQMTATNRLNMQEATDAFANYREPKFEGVSYKAMESVDDLKANIEFAPIKANAARDAVDGEWLMNGVMPTGKPGASVEVGKKRGTGAGTRLQKGDEGYVGDRGLTADEAEKLGYPAEALADDGTSTALNVVMRDQNGKPIGVATFSVMEAGSKEITPDTLAVFVPENMRRKGIATAMYDHLREQGFNIDAVSGRGSVTPDGAALASSRMRNRFTSSNSAEADLLFRPNDALESMKRDLEAAEDPQVRDAFTADFQRLLKEQPDLLIPTEMGEIKLRDIAARIAEGENELNAIRTCAIGGGAA